MSGSGLDLNGWEDCLKGLNQVSNALVSPASLTVSANSDDLSDSNAISRSSTNISLNLTEAELELQDLKIGLIQQNFDDITKEFEECLIDAIYESKNSMIPSCNMIPKGHEVGRYLIIDIGGSTLRIAIVDLTGDKSTSKSLIEESWKILQKGKIIDAFFFENIAQKAKIILEKSNFFNNHEKINVGITWSFPIVQKSPSSALISDLGKGFTVLEDFKNKDLKQLFEKYFKKQDIDIDVLAIVNDSISVFIAGSYFDNCKLALVLGTGLNASFSVKRDMLSNRKKKLIISLNNKENEEVLLNSELSLFGYNIQKYITRFDEEMCSTWKSKFDEFEKENLPHMSSIYGVFQPAEMLTSGRYVPEISRLMMVDLIKRKKLFCGNLPKNFNREYEISGKLICDFYESRSTDSSLKIFSNTFPVDENDLPLHVTEKDIETMKEIINLVISRAAILFTSLLVAIIRVLKINEENDQNQVLNIGYVGSVLQYFTSYRRKLESCLLSEHEKGNIPKIHFQYVDNSSIYGAAIAASIVEYAATHETN
ncbi:hypothetical protein PACTADRAFT_32623 [Pachysolen tannophilus NRRL Y-2460]|uniref:Phosphotransferase n=1 Tax=Pachysolen tannophilus NRRL Y-2460 TaxID=669874 RepID=A0A1E4TZE9_PACTA|nr:hypothetical protein PACTADRAFT_32623 [Pachysolen tannophilus NRRL Y-2460]